MLVDLARAKRADERGGTRAVRALNDLVRDDPRVEAVMLPVSDGLTIARKRRPEEIKR